MENNKVSFFKKLKVLFNIGKQDNIKCFFIYKFFLHSISFLYIFGGWIFLAHYLDKFFSGIDSTIVSFIIFIIINILLIILIPCSINNKNKV